MATTPNVSKPLPQETYDELMQKTTQSTANLGWLQDYLSLWRLLATTAKRIQTEQIKQRSIDEAAYGQLDEMLHTCRRKEEQLQEAYDKLYAKHIVLMDKILGEDR